VERIPNQEEKAVTAGKFAVKSCGALQSKLLKQFGHISIPLLFFIFFFIFLWRYIDPAVIYSSNGINIHTFVSIIHAPETFSSAELFYRPLYILELTPDYLREIAITPGGWTRLATTLCIYVCHYPIGGALAVTVLALFIYLVFTLYLQRIGARRPLVLPFIPAFFILTMCGWYELSYCAFLLPVACALTVTVFYQHLRPATALTQSLWLTFFFWSTWYLTQWGYLLLLLFIVINELFSKERRFASTLIAALVNAALIYIADTRLIPLSKTIHWNDFVMLSGLPLAVIGFFPLSAIILATLNRLWRTPQRKAKTICTIVQISLLVCGTVATAMWLCQEPVNRDTRIIARTTHHCINGQWEAILHEKIAPFFAGFPQKSGQLQIFMVHAINHALSRTGRVGDSLFSFPQATFSVDPLLMLKSMSIQSYVNWIMVLDLTMDLGMVNTAEKIAGELLENMGPYPDIIYRRALVQIASGNKDAAAVYLNKLANMPFYRAEARRLLGMLGNDKALGSEPRISAMCANRDTIDYLLDNDLNNDFLFKNLLQSNPGNKVAYDYLMTYCLLTGKLKGLSILAPMSYTFGYTTLPRCWDEALYYYKARNSWQMSSSEISYSGARLETAERFKKFTEAWLQVENNPEASVKLAPLFGDSYFYFSAFRYSPGALHE
jgi:hypothetical protein